MSAQEAMKDINQDTTIFIFEELEDLALVNGFISSKIEKPPYKTMVETYTPFGYTNKAMFHENENDGYDFKNEKPMLPHFIDDFETEIFWRLPSL